MKTRFRSGRYHLHEHMATRRQSPTPTLPHQGRRRWCGTVAATPACRSTAPSPPMPGGDSMIGEDVMAPNTTETDQLREQLLRAQRLSSVGTLASSVAHEFNNILTTIINYAKLGMRANCD